MKKIPTIFERDWNGDKSRVMDKINPAAQWVFDGDGVPTRKLDGTACMVRDGKLYKRREIKDGQPVPPEFETVDIDNRDGTGVGWMPVTDAPEDRFHREAFKGYEWDGTYELVGPKVQGNPEHFDEHTLVPHSISRLRIYWPLERTFDGLRSYLAANNVEGIVFHHPDGRMAKIKGKDFGFKRQR